MSGKCCDYFQGTSHCLVCEAEASETGEPGKQTTEANTTETPSSEAPTFSYDELQIGVPEKSGKHWRPDQSLVLTEHDILEITVKKDQRNRAKIRTRKGLFCCHITENGKFKVIKVLRTKMIRKEVGAPPISDDEIKESYKELPPSSDWREEYEAWMQEEKVQENTKMRVIPIEEFLLAIQQAA